MSDRKKTKAAGDARERQVKKVLEAAGYEVRKARMSFGSADLYAVKNGKRYLIQVKANTGSPWMNFRAGEREALLDDSEIAGATPVLIHWPPRGKMMVYKQFDWPKMRVKKNG